MDYLTIESETTLEKAFNGRTEVLKRGVLHSNGVMSGEVINNGKMIINGIFTGLIINNNILEIHGIFNGNINGYGKVILHPGCVVNHKKY